MYNKFWDLTKNSILLSIIVGYVFLNILSIILTGNVSWLILITNIIPTLGLFFIVSINNEHRKQLKLKPNKNVLKA